MGNRAYERVTPLGQGAFGRVYKTKDPSTGEECVMKTIPIEEETTAKKEEVKAMFQNEVALMKEINSLSSPYLVKYITSYVDEKKSEYVIIMKYYSGGSLEEIIKDHKNKEKRIPDHMVLRYMKQILLGVKSLHENRIIHRNLKPGNILVDSEGDLKVSDYRISKQLSEHAKYAKTSQGTSWYSSPEVLQGENYNFCADIWSLGCILHELCCLEPPCTQTNVLNLVKWWKDKKYNVNVLPNIYSKEIKNLIVSMLNYDRKARPNCQTLLSNNLFKGIYPIIGKGEEYEGEVEDGKPHGKGIYKKSNGDKYEGDFINGKMNGKGIFYYANKHRYEGEYKDDKKNGKGVFYYANGEKYDGEYKDDKKSGKGIFYYANKDRYEGEYKDDNRNGKGTLWKVDGEKYDGEFKDDKRNGKGISYLPNKDRYEGEYKDAKKNGKGIFYFANGNRYEGEFKDGEIDGKGIFYFSNGNRYEGELKGPIINTKGILYYANRDRYEGDFKDDMENGKGIYYYADGDKYEGEFKDGNKNGKGTLYYANEEKYEGEFKSGDKNGKGKYYYTNGDRYEGDFKDDMENNKGIYYYANGDRYEGEYKDGMANGKGILYKANGEKYKEEWEQGEMMKQEDIKN